MVRQVAPSPTFERRGQDLFTVLDISVTQAALGAELAIGVRRALSLEALSRGGDFQSSFQPVSAASTNWVWNTIRTGAWYHVAASYDRGSFANVPDLIQAIFEFIAVSNESAKPFVWKATVTDLLAKFERCRTRLEEISPGCTLPRRRKKKAA